MCVCKRSLLPDSLVSRSFGCAYVKASHGDGTAGAEGSVTSGKSSSRRCLIKEESRGPPLPPGVFLRRKFYDVGTLVRRQWYILVFIWKLGLKLSNGITGELQG